MVKKRCCPACQGDYFNVLYLGFPMKACVDDDDCATIFGFWSFILLLIPITDEEGGISFVVYGRNDFPKANYWRMLWDWLTNKIEDSEEIGLDLEEYFDEIEDNRRK